MKKRWHLTLFIFITIFTLLVGNYIVFYAKIRESQIMLNDRMHVANFFIQDKIKILDSLNKYIIKNFETSEKHCEDIIKVLYESNEGLKNISIAPSGIQKFVYPLAGNENVIGHNLITDKRGQVSTGIEIAIKEHRLNFNGPYKLRQGGYGIVVRKPVYKSGQFWGITALVIDLEEILAQAQLVPFEHFNITVLDKNRKAVYPENYVTNNIYTIINTWQYKNFEWSISASPKYGWFEMYKWNFIKISILIISVNLLFYLLFFLILKIQYHQRIMFEQKKFADMGQMISAIAHQWRQPINTLGLKIQDVKEAYEFNEINDQYLEEFVSSSMEIIKHMSTTIDDFRTFFMVDKMKKKFAISLVIIDVLKLVSAKLKTHNIKYSVKCYCDNAEQPCTDIMDNPDKIICQNIIEGYSGELQQVFLNIIHNAVDSIEDKKKKLNRFVRGEIKINIYNKIDNAAIEIEDNGTGIPSHLINKIFNPYFTTKQEGEGTGIGLYMTRIIVEKHMKGKISVKNTGDGAVFYVTFPVVKN